MEKIPVSMPSTINDPLLALALLDFAMGDEWAAFTAQYVEDHIAEAIAVVEEHGLFQTLPGRYQMFRENYLWNGYENGSITSGY